MEKEPPKLIAIDHDNYHAEHVGRTSDGRQFFLTTPFIPASHDGKSSGSEFVALFLFNALGTFIDAKIEDFGPRASMNEEKRKASHDALLQELGEVTFQRIVVAPFSVERFGVHFGLILRVPDDDDDVWAVEMQPGNYMAFFEPWDSGDYDT